MLDVTTWAIVRGHEVFRDDAESDLFWVLPSTVDVAVDPEGRPELSLVVYRGDDTRGGMLTATLRLATADERRRLIADDLRRLLGRAVRVRAVEPERARVGLGPDDLSLAEGRPSPQGKLAVSTNLAVPLAAAARRALEQGEPLPLHASLTVQARRPSIAAVVALRLGPARERLRSLGDGPQSAEGLRRAVDDLLERGTMRVEADGPSPALDDALQLVLADLLLESTGPGAWRLAEPPADAPAELRLDLRQPATVSLRRTLVGDLGRLIAGRGAAPTVREVDLDADDFFATRSLRLEVAGDFAANEVHAVLVELRAGAEMRSELFEAPGSKAVRFRGRPSVELRTRVMTRGGEALGRRGERSSPWRAVEGEVEVLMLDELAPLWALELRAEAIDWSRFSHVQAVVRYVDDSRPYALTQAEPRATVRIRPEDPSVHDVVISVRYLGPSGTQEHTIRVRAPGVVVIGPPP
ncbi:MAG: hypothetical protein KC501_02115 [Myxococcales bacterium]|nr:hypothetical protein [Myxococcales bacterium]